MCNAFEKSEPNKNVNKEFYYKYDSSIYDDLKNIDGDIWEDKERFTKEQYLNGLHPNNEGYKIIANILKKFIDDKFI
jgi:lysophospholipase L1-like esterase